MATMQQKILETKVCSRGSCTLVRPTLGFQMFFFVNFQRMVTISLPLHWFR